MYRIGIIGCGGRMSSLLPHLETEEGLVIAAVADPRVDDMRGQFTGRNIHIYPSAEEMLQSERLDGAMIGTRCSLHTPMGLLVGEYNLPLFLEKPVSTSWEQLHALEGLFPQSERIVVSFPLRRSAIVDTVKSIVDSGELGKIQHVQAYNNVFYARGYYKKWYRDEGETGGLFLQKATHDFDYISYLLGDERPVRICAVKSKQIFKGELPEGQKCSDCAYEGECPESPRNLAFAGEPKSGEFCCFARDTGNEDSGSAIIEYESGMHAVYSQNFFVRKAAGKRGARLMGYRGTVEFDFNTGVVEVYYHFADKHSAIRIGSDSGHSGGADPQLHRNITAASDTIKPYLRQQTFFSILSLSNPRKASYRLKRCQARSPTRQGRTHR